MNREESQMSPEMPMDALLDHSDFEISERETLEWLAMETSNLRELVRLALLDEVATAE